MKRIFVLSFVFVLLMGSTVFSQSYVFQFREQGSKLWGYASTDGKIFIEPKFKLSSPFSEYGVASVMYKTKYYIINLKSEIMKAEVETVQPYINYWNGSPQEFFDGYLVIIENSLMGCLNHLGKLAIPVQYERFTHFDSGFALAERDKIYYVIDKQGKEIPLEAKDIVNIWHFSEGLGTIEVKGQKWGFVNGEGKTVIEPLFNGTGYFHGGLAWARAHEGKMGYINKTGQWVIPPQFEVAKDFDPESGLAVVKIDGNWEYTNTEGKISFFNESEKVNDFSNGLVIGNKSRKIGFLDKNGQWVIQPQFDDARSFHFGYAAAELDGRWGIIDKTGSWVVQPKYTDIRDVVEVK